MLDLELDLLEEDKGGLFGRVGSLALNWDLKILDSNYNKPKGIKVAKEDQMT